MPESQKSREIPLIWLLVLAIILILISIIIDLLSTMHSKSLSQQEIINEITAPQFFAVQTLGAFLREFGFASMIAWVIAMTIERVARERDIERTAETRRLIAQDVFGAVIKSFIPENIRDITFDTVLLAPITRSYMRLDVDLLPLPNDHHDLSRHGGG